jgi:hypothetical protein
MREESFVANSPDGYVAANLIAVSTRLGTIQFEIDQGLFVQAFPVRDATAVLPPLGATRILELPVRTVRVHGGATTDLVAGPMVTFTTWRLNDQRTKVVVNYVPWYQPLVERLVSDLAGDYPEISPQLPCLQSANSAAPSPATKRSREKLEDSDRWPRICEAVDLYLEETAAGISQDDAADKVRKIVRIKGLNRSTLNFWLPRVRAWRATNPTALSS